MSIKANGKSFTPTPSTVPEQVLYRLICANDTHYFCTINLISFLQYIGYIVFMLRLLQTKIEAKHICVLAKHA
jgi:hypothetical protein